jgi:hypothetical protein
MIEYAISIDDRVKRTETAKAIVRVMAEIHPDTKENDTQAAHHNQSSDYWRKLWDHLFIIANYRLDVDAPFPKPKPEEKENKIAQHQYIKSKIAFHTYGRNMEAIIKKVAQYPLPQREIMGKILANHLKKLYIIYNRNAANDELILNQLKDLSGGKITLPEDFQLISTKEIYRHNGNANYVQAGSSNHKKLGKKRKRKRKPATV